MNSFVLFILSILPSIVMGYTNQYDRVDLEAILKNPRLYKKYIDCLTNEGKCTPDGKLLKDLLPDAMATACSKCSEAQRQRSEKVIKFLIEHKPEDYAKLETIYDPEGAYKMKYKEEAKLYGIQK